MTGLRPGGVQATASSTARRQSFRSSTTIIHRSLGRSRDAVSTFRRTYGNRLFSRSLEIFQLLFHCSSGRQHSTAPSRLANCRVSGARYYHCLPSTVTKCISNVGVAIGKERGNVMKRDGLMGVSASWHSGLRMRQICCLSQTTHLLTRSRLTH